VSKYDKKIQDKWIRSLSEQEKERDIPLIFSIAFIFLGHSDLSVCAKLC
jgi:hypothetical protein